MAKLVELDASTGLSKCRTIVAMCGGVFLQATIQDKGPVSLVCTVMTVLPRGEPTPSCTLLGCEHACSVYMTISIVPALTLKSALSWQNISHHGKLYKRVRAVRTCCGRHVGLGHLTTVSASPTYGLGFGFALSGEV